MVEVTVYLLYFSLLVFSLIYLVSYPLCLVNFIPSSAADKPKMVYSSKCKFISDTLQIGKVLNCREHDDL